MYCLHVPFLSPSSNSQDIEKLLSAFCCHLILRLQASNNDPACLISQTNLNHVTCFSSVFLDRRIRLHSILSLFYLLQRISRNAYKSLKKKTEAEDKCTLVLLEQSQEGFGKPCFVPHYLQNLTLWLS